MATPFIVDIDPVALHLGPLAIRWYGLMYLGGFLGGWWLGERRRRAGRLGTSSTALTDLLYYVVLGIVVGGRVGYMLVYQPLRWIWTDPAAILRIWDGGMSFHGGLVGVLLALAWWAHREHARFFDVVDFAAPLVPVGLFLGRIGNFINGELWGKPSHLPWAMIFPYAQSEDLAFLGTHPAWLATFERYGGLPRHPSQLYEALLEGAVMFLVLWLFSRRPRHRYAVSGLFALLYGCFRFGVEFVRLPDAQIGYLAGGWLTMGQVLSVPLILIGIGLLWLSRRAPVVASVVPQPAATDGTAEAPSPGGR